MIEFSSSSRIKSGVEALLESFEEAEVAFGNLILDVWDLSSSELLFMFPCEI